MMRKIIYSLISTFLLQSGFANDTIFKSSFENEFSVEWQEPTISIKNFARTSAAKYTGDFGCHIEFDTTGQKANLFTQKNLTFESAQKYRFSFWYKGITPSDNSTSNIKIFKNDGTKIHQVNFTCDQTEWTEFAIDYTCTEDAADGYALFSFRPTDAGTGEFYFDDFIIEKYMVEPGFFNDLKTINVESDESIKWTQFGPGMSGNNKSAFWHPTDPNVLFIGPNMGNSYGTWDKGLTYETILNEDETDYKRGYRGPIEPTSLDFSRQDADFGMCTDERNQGIFSTTDRGHTWTRLSTTTFDGLYVDAVTVDPKDEDIWYAGGGRLRNLGSNLYPKSQPKGILADPASLNKIWKSTDKGATWTLKNSGLEPETGIESLLVDPVNSDIVYASTSTGFYKSLNGGDTWEKKISGIDYDMLRAFDYHYDTLNDVFTFIVISNPMWQASGSTLVDSAGGLFKSTDRGESWSKIEGNLALDMHQFQDNSDIKKSYYHCAAYIFDMSDENFQAAYPTLPSKITIRFNTIEIDPNDVNNIYLNNEYSNASRNNFKPGQVWRSADGGTNWHVCLRNGNGWEPGSGDYNYWVNRGNPMKTNISLKYKKEWVNRDLYDRKGCNFVKFNADGSALHTQMAKVSLMSYDKGVTWVDIDDEYTTEGEDSYVGAGNSNVPGHGFFQHPLMPNKVFCFAGENSLWVTNNEGEKIRQGAQGANFYKILDDENSLSWYAVHPQDTNIHYALFFRQAKKGKLMRSTDNGESWEEHGEAVPYWDITGHSGDQSVHQNHLTIDPENPDNMYFVVPRKARNMEFVGDSEIHWGVHKTSDGGENWEDANVGLPESLDATMIAIDPNNSSTLYVAIQHTDGGLFKSTNYGDSWAEVESTVEISGDFGINDIHFALDGKVYITAGSKNGDINNGGVWVSNDSLKTWKKIFDYPWTNRIETAIYDPNTILVSTLANTIIGGKNAGVYLSKDGGENWIKINRGNGQSDRVNDIAIDNYNPGKYYASTYGSGWYVAIDADVADIVDATGLTAENSTITLEVGEKKSAKMQVTPANATFKNIEWKSENSSIAKVSATGIITGIANGTTHVTTTLVGTNISAQIQVIVGTGNSVKNIDRKQVQIHPNPTNDELTVSGINGQMLNSTSIEIYNITGQKIRDFQIPDSSNLRSFTIPVSYLENGTYLLNLKSQNQKETIKFIKN